MYVFWTKIAFLLVYSGIHIEINIYYVTIIHSLVIFSGVLTKVTEQKHDSQNLFSQQDYNSFQNMWLQY